MIILMCSFQLKILYDFMDYFTSSPVPSHSPVFIGFDSLSSKRSLLVWEGQAESHVGSCCAPTHSYLFEVLSKIPRHPWYLTLCISMSFSPGGIFIFLCPGPLPLSKTTSSLYEPIFSALPLCFRAQASSFPDLNRTTLQKQMSDQPHN